MDKEEIKSDNGAKPERKEKLYNCALYLDDFKKKWEKTINESKKIADEKSKNRKKKIKRTISFENDFLVNNIFDSFGNYDHICTSCLKEVGISSNRLARLRKWSYWKKIQ